jgi:hypothetical protein
MQSCSNLTDPKERKKCQAENEKGNKLCADLNGEQCKGSDEKMTAAKREEVRKKCQWRDVGYTMYRREPVHCCEDTCGGCCQYCCGLFDCFPKFYPMSDQNLIDLAGTCCGFMFRPYLALLPSPPVEESLTFSSHALLATPEEFPFLGLWLSLLVTIAIYFGIAFFLHRVLKYEKPREGIMEFFGLVEEWLKCQMCLLSRGVL